MAKYLVQKSNPLSGEVEISGAKNAVLPIMAAALLSEEECTLFDVPALRDVDVLTQLLTHIGAVVKKADTNTLNIYTPNINTYEAPFELVKKGRRPFFDKRDFAPTRASVCASAHEHTLSAQSIFRDVHAAAKNGWNTIRGLRAANSARRF